jgi:hypothetical protein
MAKNGGKKVGDFVVKSKVKEKLSKLGCNSSGDMVSALNGLVDWYVQQAAARAKANKRKTVRAHDFLVM